MGQQHGMEPVGSPDTLAHSASAGPAGQPASQTPASFSDTSPNNTEHEPLRSPEREYWQPPSERIAPEGWVEDEVPTDEATISTWLTRPMVIARARAQATSLPSPQPLRPQTQREAPKVTFWQAAKWPLRKLLLGVYLTTEAMRAQPRKALTVIAIILAVLVAGGLASQPQRAARATPTPIVAVEQAGRPPLPISIQRYLQGQQHFNAEEMWAAYAPTTRTSMTLTKEQFSAAIAQQKAAGLRITRYVYSGGYQAPDGTAHYTIEVYASEKGKTHISTWFFTIGADGLITQRVDLTPQ